MANPDFCLLSNYNSCSRNGIPWISSSTGRNRCIIRNTTSHSERNRQPPSGNWYRNASEDAEHKKRNPSFLCTGILPSDIFRTWNACNRNLRWYPCIGILRYEIYRSGGVENGRADNGNTEESIIDKKRFE